MNQINLDTTSPSSWPSLMTVRETARVLRSSRNAVYDLISLGKLVSLRLGTHRIPKKSLLRLIEEGTSDLERYNAPTVIKGGPKHD